MTAPCNTQEVIKEYKYTRNGKDIVIRRKYEKKLPNSNRYSKEFDNISDQLLTAKTYASKLSIYNQHYRPISSSCFYTHFNKWLNNRNLQDNQPIDK